MIIVDRLLAERASEGRPVRVAMFGAGFMARGIVNQIVNSVPGMRLVAICNRNVDRARAAFAEAGVEKVQSVSTANELKRINEIGAVGVTDNPDVLCEADHVDCLIDATGALEYGARITLKAIACGKHMVSMNAELDGTVGAILKRKADAAGVILTGCDGDQPGVQMNLYRFVRSIGLTPLVCGNVKGLQDPYRNPTTQEGFAKQWGQNPYMVTSFADGTKINFEQAIVANATGMTIAKRGMSGSIHPGHVDELTSHYDIDELRSLGGIVDYVVGSKPSPGVFVLATHDDPKQKHYLNLYKLGPGPLYSFYTPYHLCHFEVPLSVARAVLARDSVLQPLGAPQLDVVATAKVDLHPGDVIDALGGYKVYGQCEVYRTSMLEDLLPIALSEGCQVTRAVKKDSVLTFADVIIPAGRAIDALRVEQNRVFFGE
jgi:predicted homoserine dehydrogenase-like protein